MGTLATAAGVFFSAFGGGLVQASTGFGSGIVMMMFLPIFMSILEGSYLSTVVTVFMTVSIVWRYRSHIRPRMVVLPGVFYLIASTLGIRLAVAADVSRLKFWFGLFLVAVACYFMFAANKIHLNPTPLAAFCCGSLAGLVSGLFGIGGPPIALYFISAIPEDKHAYLGTVQLFFTITCCYTTLLRTLNGIFKPSMLPMIALGVVGILAGTFVGGRIVEKINVEQMKKLIYIFLAICGVLTLLDV